MSGFKAAISGLFMGAALTTAAIAEQPSTILVLDASGSMWGQIDGVNKITIAREVVAGIMADFPADRNLGLVAYGHRERGQCSDIETLVAPAPDTAAEIARIVEGLNPRGMTPMTDAVIAAAKALRHTEQAATVILVSDGLETCNPDPCAAARALAETGIDFTTHVIGFDVSGQAGALMQMQCIADETGGRFMTADNADELVDALQQVVTPEELPPAEVTVTAVSGERDGPEIVTPLFWSFSQGEDVIEVEGNPAVVTLPAGQWMVEGYHVAEERSLSLELQVVAGQSGQHMLVFDIIEAEVVAEVFAPDRVVIGAEFAVSWQAEGLNPRDYVTIVPVGAETGAYTSYDRVGEKTEGKLRAPANAGAYEVRLQDEAAARVFATVPVEVVEAVTAVTAPDHVTVGAEFAVSWQAEGLNPRDYVTIVPVGAETGAYIGYERLNGRSEGKLRAPAEPGLYEVRLQLDTGDRVLASTAIEVREGEVTVTAPSRVRAGADVPLGWTGAIYGRDYITIVPAGAADGEYAGYLRVREMSEGSMTAPAEPGLYEVRYHLESGNRVMARQPLEVLAADAALDFGAGLVAPARAAPGDAVSVGWTMQPADAGADHRLTIARLDQDDFSWIAAQPVAGVDAAELVMPDQPDRYEIRFLDLTNRQVLGRSIIEVGP